MCPLTISNMNISKTRGPIASKFYLKHHWGGGKPALGFGPDRIRTRVSMATDSSHRVIMGKTVFFHLGGHYFCLVSYTCLVYPFYFLNILELGMVELDLPVYFLCPLILIFSSSQGQTVSDLNIVKN